MPVLLLWNKIFLLSAEIDAPPIRVVSMNCSMVYCFTCRGASDFFCAASGIVIDRIASVSASALPALFFINTPVPQFVVGSRFKTHVDSRDSTLEARQRFRKKEGADFVRAHEFSATNI